MEKKKVEGLREYYKLPKSDALNRKPEKKKPKMEIQVKKMWWAWYNTEGLLSMRKYINRHFDKYFEVK